MKDKIEFEKHLQTSTFHSPLKGGKLDVQELEIRKDPLTGRRSVFNPNLEDKVAVFFGATDTALIEKLSSQSEPRCFLCGERWKQSTPEYPENLVPGGRVEVGESVLFPNLFPISQVHAVIRVGSKHYLPLQDFTAPLIAEAFGTCRKFVEFLSRANRIARFMTINGNYLGPAGASILHPHFQMLGSDIPFTHLQELLLSSSAYLRQHDSCYWTDLVEKEQELGLRFVKKTGAVSWVTGFSPQGTNEVMGILPGRRNILEMDTLDYRDLAEGLSAVLKGYGGMGISTFNFSLYSGPLDARDESFRCFIRVISRQNVYENYRTDDYFLQKLLRNEIILKTPEDLAAVLRESF